MVLSQAAHEPGSHDAAVQLDDSGALEEYG
jgi:hypothetical protein